MATVNNADNKPVSEEENVKMATVNNADNKPVSEEEEEAKRLSFELGRALDSAVEQALDMETRGEFGKCE